MGLIGIVAIIAIWSILLHRPKDESMYKNWHCR